MIMTDKPDTAPQTVPEPPAVPGAEAGGVKLSQEFYRSLRPEPGCEINGICNDCGRCEH